MNLIPVNKLKKDDSLFEWSNPKIAQKKAFEILGKDAILYKSDKPDKKYKYYNPLLQKYQYFGQMNFQDFTKHLDEDRRNRFLNRNKKWANAEPYSPAFMAYYIIW
jgi:hypothetical protein